MGEPIVLLLCIIAAAVAVYLPQGIVGYARFQIGYDASAPRAMFDRLPAYAQRATWAHQNGFESFSLFAIACLMVYASGKYSEALGLLSAAHVACRLGYNLCYICDWPWVRSGLWAIGSACTGLLMLGSLG